MIEKKEWFIQFFRNSEYQCDVTFDFLTVNIRREFGRMEKMHKQCFYIDIDGKNMEMMKYKMRLQGDGIEK